MEVRLMSHLALLMYLFLLGFVLWADSTPNKSKTKQMSVACRQCPGSPSSCWNESQVLLVVWCGVVCDVVCAMCGMVCVVVCATWCVLWCVPCVAWCSSRLLLLGFCGQHLVFVDMLHVYGAYNVFGWELGSNTRL